MSRYLLDTHCLLWWWSAESELSDAVRSLIENPVNTIIVSAASAWEISTKTRIGKLPQGEQIIAQWQQRIDEDHFENLEISAEHALKAGMLNGEHRDPFDRMLSAQSLIEGIPLLSKDAKLDQFGIARIW
jgi:PIN domain nuclease of toxin-antitoxin system